MRTETSRSEFEEWARDKVTSLKRDDVDGEYFWEDTEIAWEAWQTAKQLNKNFVEAGRICAQIYIARNITLSNNEVISSLKEIDKALSDNKVLSLLKEIDKLYRDENHN